MTPATRRIGFFGGTFDPIHFGHLHLALCLMEVHSLEEIFFCPAHFSPHKSPFSSLASKEQRLEMVQLAIEPIKKFTALDWEISREGPSYTIDTVRMLLTHAANRGEKIAPYLILGEDALVDFSQWKEVEELVSLAPPLVGTRGVNSFFPSNLDPSLREALEKGKTKIPIMEISSTEIRQRLHQGKYCGYLVPAKVLDYIHRYQLY